MPDSTTYCELSSAEEREAIGDEEFLEALIVHHVAADLCGLRGSEVDLKFVTEDGGGACYDTRVPALGFVYKAAPSNAFVRADQPRDQRLHVVLHECRHTWQFLRDVPLHTEEAEEADADGFARHYLPKLRPVLDDTTRAAAKTLARRVLDAQPSNQSVQAELDELAEDVVDEVGLERAEDVLFDVDPALVGTPSGPKAIAKRVARKVTEKTLERDDVTVSCGCA